MTRAPTPTADDIAVTMAGSAILAGIATGTAIVATLNGHTLWAAGFWIAAAVFATVWKRALRKEIQHG
jgi:hydrogenase/urease accessory protein HupE